MRGTISTSTFALKLLSGKQHSLFISGDSDRRGAVQGDIQFYELAIKICRKKKARRRLVGFTVTISPAVKIDIADFSIIVHPSLNIYCFLIHFYIKKQQTFRNTLLTP
jgi:hypothetical protein